MEIAENRLLKRLAGLGGKGGDIVRGMGHDGAVLLPSEGRHVFTRGWARPKGPFRLRLPEALGRREKAVHVNVSDALAMGAKPLHFLVTVGVPATIGAGVMEELYRGMGRAACESRAAPAGGETTEAARALFIDVSVPLPIVGEVSHDRGRASWRKGRKGTLP